MKISPLLKKILISSWFLAAIPSILIILFLPPLSSKFTLSVETQQNSYIQFAYSDLNSDSVSESIYSSKGIPYYYITARDYDQHIYDQWNLADSLDHDLSGFFFGNYDHDRFQEIYVFTHKNDSLFLNLNELLEPSGTEKERIFITKIGYINREVVAVLKPAGFFDENGDGLDELYFSISCGYRTGPRRLYCFDIAAKRLLTSQFTGIICLDPKMVDADGDQRPEIFGFMSASGNYPANVPFSDSSTWLMVFNDQLKFEFPPVEFPGFANALYVNAYDNGFFKGYILLHTVGGADTTVLRPQIMLYSPDGKLIQSRLLKDITSSENVWLSVIKKNQTDRIFLISDKIFELNDRLNVIRSVELPFKSIFCSYQVDINNDREDELLIYSREFEKLAVYNAELQRLAEQSIKTPFPLWKFYHYFSRDHEHKLYIATDNGGFFLRLNKNNYYYLGYLAYPGIYLMFFFFILLVRRINTRQVEHRESLKRRLVTLQLQGIKAQLDPHFTFNTLNSIAALIYLEDRQTAYDYMNKFTQLLRSLLNDAERIYRSLVEELEFTTTYLDLEKLRFGEKFNYKIEIGEGVSRKEEVPKLVLHTFAENAIKHGIMPRDKDGMLRIRIDRENDYLKITIEDNGIGRERAEGNSSSSGKGLKLTGEFYDILNQINKRPIKHLITDLYDKAGHPSGTRVEVWVPVDEEEGEAKM